MSTIRYLADEDLRAPIVKAIRRLDPAIEIATVQELGMSGYSDAQLLEYACANQWIVVSHDVNTLKPLAEQRVLESLGLAGVFMVVQSKPNRLVAESLVQIWATTSLQDWRDCVVYVPF